MTWRAAEGWEISPARAPLREDRVSFPYDLVRPGRVEVVESFDAAPRRGVLPGAGASASVARRGDETYLFAVRHESGAITFHPARAGKGRTLRFELPFHAGVRRGLGAVVRVFLLKILGRLADRALPGLSAAWERAHWKRKRLVRGLVSVTAEGLRAGRLPAADSRSLPVEGERSLLLIHGIFSNAESAFGELATTAGSGGETFLDAARRLYGNRILAFNHFTVSLTPEENARELLAALPGGTHDVDVVTHSRGGIVLRSLLERPRDSGQKRLRLGRAVLVAAPNGGSPLASPARWATAAGWFANLADLFPKSPFASALDFVSEALVWIAHRAGGAIPGIAALSTESPLIRALQSGPGLPDGAGSALAASFTPGASLLLRMADAGVGAFFGSANDLVVPSEGGWRAGAGPSIPGERIGCFGPGGNISPEGEAVHHVGFFGRRETVDFLLSALSRKPQALPPLDPARDLPHRGRPVLRSARRTRSTKAGPAGGPSRSTRTPTPRAADEPLHLVVLSSADRSEAQLLATYGGARVLARFGTRGGAAGERMRRIIARHEGILGFLGGKPGAHRLPEGAELEALGAALFETLFPGDARRLYDAARARTGGRALDVVFTSTLDWIADKPWELAFDPARRAFLATEEVRFTRNVVTPVPADALPPRRGPLRILVAAAQPAGSVPLSTKEEETVLRRGFEPLVRAGFAELEILRAVTPELLQRRLAGGRFDVLHVIGHGGYDEKERLGFLVFEDGRGAARPVDSGKLREILAHRGLRLVFLNACETGRGGRADFNRGVAPALLAAGLPAVLANQYPVLDSSALAFARHFYAALAEGTPLAEAVREARIAVRYALDGTSIDWAVPVLYARDPGALLCRPGRAPHPAHPIRRPAGRKRVAPRIAVWDVNQTLPALEAATRFLNRAPGGPSFEVVSLPAPLGAWRLRRPAHGGPHGLLDAAALALRIAGQPDALGAVRLLCLTTFHVEGASRDPRIAVLAATGREEPRALASVLLAAAR